MWAVSAPLQQLACLKMPHRALLLLPLSEEQQLLLCPGLNGEVYGEAGLGSYARVCVVELECLQFILHAATRWKLSTGALDSQNSNLLLTSIILY
jgi:hypothetical protein